MNFVATSTYHSQAHRGVAARGLELRTVGRRKVDQRMIALALQMFAGGLLSGWICSEGVT
jgi:hypothetical protein